MDKEVDYLTESPAEAVPSGKAEIEIVTKAEMKTEDIDVLEVEELEQENKEITETEQLAAKVDTVAETGETVGVEKTRAIDIDAEVAHIAEKLEAETAVPDMESQTESRAKTVCVQLDLEHAETIQPESKETEVEKKTFVAEAVPEFMKADEKKPGKMAVLEPKMEIETEEAEVAKIQKAAEVGFLAKSEETVMVRETKAVDIEAEPESAEVEEEEPKVLVVPETEVEIETGAAEVTEIPRAAEVEVSAEPDETEIVEKTGAVDIPAELESAVVEDEEHKVLVVPEPEKEIETEAAEVTEIPKAAEVEVSAEPGETVMVKETKAVDTKAELESAEVEEEEHKVLVVFKTRSGN